MFELKKYFIDNLYIAWAGPITITYTKPRVLSIIEDEAFLTIIEKKKEKYHDLIRKTDYEIFIEKDFYYLENHLADLYIAKIQPLRLELKIDANVRTIKRSKIFELFNELNYVKESKTVISNPFFIEVDKVREKIQDKMSVTEKELYLEKLMNIANSYTEEIINNYQNIKNNPSVELNILQKYISMLVDLESDIDKINDISSFSNSLLNDLESLNQNVKQYHK